MAAHISGRTTPKFTHPPHTPDPNHPPHTPNGQGTSHRDKPSPGPPRLRRLYRRPLIPRRPQLPAAHRRRAAPPRPALMPSPPSDYSARRPRLAPLATPPTRGVPSSPSAESALIRRFATYRSGSLRAASRKCPAVEGAHPRRSRDWHRTWYGRRGRRAQTPGKQRGLARLTHRRRARTRRPNGPTRPKWRSTTSPPNW